MWIKLLAMPPMTGVASGFISSAPVRVLHMMGSKLATMVRTVMTLGRGRKRAPSLIAWIKSSRLNATPRSCCFFFQHFFEIDISAPK